MRLGSWAAILGVLTVSACGNDGNSTNPDGHGGAGGQACIPESSAATCAMLECGTTTNNCGETVDCDAVTGGCAAAESCVANTCTGGSTPGDMPVDEDYDYVVQLTGSNTGPSVVDMIDALGPGTVLVRPADGSATATISSGLSVPRADVTFWNLQLSGSFDFDDGTVMWTVTARPAQFSSGTANNWVIRNSLWSGGDGTSEAAGCAGNVYGQNFIGGDPSGSVNWTIEDSTFENYAPTPGQCSTQHTEAFYIECGAKQGHIRNNTFTNNGNTAHIFFTWWPTQSTECYPDDICVEGNSFGPTWGAYNDIDSRSELWSQGLSIHLDPAQWAPNSPEANVPTEWLAACPP